MPGNNLLGRCACGDPSQAFEFKEEILHIILAVTMTGTGPSSASYIGSGTKTYDRVRFSEFLTAFETSDFSQNIFTIYRQGCCSRFTMLLFISKDEAFSSTRHCPPSPDDTASFGAAVGVGNRTIDNPCDSDTDVGLVFVMGAGLQLCSGSIISITTGGATDPILIDDAIADSPITIPDATYSSGGTSITVSGTLELSTS